MSTSDTASDSGNQGIRETGQDSPPPGGPLHSRPLLVIRMDDLPPEVRGGAIARQAGARVFGGDHDDSLTSLYDALPGVIARRLERITPKSFTLCEIELEMELAVAIPGVDISGTVKVTLKPG